MDLRQRVADWAIHIFREHNKEADASARKGNVVWSEVTGLYVVWDGSCVVLR